MRLPFLILASALALMAAAVPRGTEFEIRLKSKVSSEASRPKDPVEAVIITPVLSADAIRIAPGAKLMGEVVAVKQPANANERGELQISFTKLTSPDGKTAATIKGRIVDVDNAREMIDDSGKILGILASETLSARMDQGIAKVTTRSSGLGGLLEIAKGAVVKQAEGNIDYAPGVEMTFRVLEPFEWNAAPQLPALQPISDENALLQFVKSQPFQTVAENPPSPSDITNLMFVGTEEAVRRAFTAAGWTTAQELTKLTALETFRAIAELRGYKEAPVSTLLLGGKPPQLVFQKALNTFAKRHHLRVWQQPEPWNGKPVWVSSATHDTGIEFSEANHTFIHRIDSRIDRERAKVVSDLLFTGQVKSLALVDRPDVPQKSQNATGDDLITDGRMAVLVID